MIKFGLIFVFSCCLAENNPFIGMYRNDILLRYYLFYLGYDFGQHYSRIRIFEFDSYSDVKFLKFNIHGPTNLANWSISVATEGKCLNNFANIHLYV
jgi:hypothetical protein